MRELTIRGVGGLLGLKLPRAGYGKSSRAYCPFRKHKRKDPTFRVFKSRQTGDEMYKCWSCDPPGNVGDAIGFYARMRDIDRLSALKELARYGFDVPGGWKRRHAEVDPKSRPSRLQPAVPIRGTIRGPYLDLDLDVWRKWKTGENGLLTIFAEQRGFSVQLLRKLDVVQVGEQCIGFGYRHPDTMLPCRVKVRALDKKMFWIEPRSELDQRIAYGPLYLAHDLLEVELDKDRAVIITEGEIDALSLRQMAYKDVVSLPDGASSAGQCSLEPLQNFAYWLVATDDDAEGSRAWGHLRERALLYNVIPIRVCWRKVMGNPQEGEELMEYKDANEALMAGFERKDFDRCLKLAAQQQGLPWVEVR